MDKVLSFVVAAVLTVLFWKPDEKKAANQAKQPNISPQQEHFC